MCCKFNCFPSNDFHGNWIKPVVFLREKKEKCFRKGKTSGYRHCSYVCRPFVISSFTKAFPSFSHTKLLLSSSNKRFFFFFSFSSISKQLQKISVRSQENNRKKKQFDTILCVCNELDVRENQKRDLPRLHPSIQINNSLSFNFLYFFLYHTKLGC